VKSGPTIRKRVRKKTPVGGGAGFPGKKRVKRRGGGTPKKKRRPETPGEASIACPRECHLFLSRKKQGAQNASQSDWKLRKGVFNNLCTKRCKTRENKENKRQTRQNTTHHQAGVEREVPHLGGPFEKFTNKLGRDVVF